MQFSSGERFDSFEKLEAKLNRFKETNYIELWKSDARKIDSAIKSGRLFKEKVINPALIYSENIYVFMVVNSTKEVQESGTPGILFFIEYDIIA